MFTLLLLTILFIVGNTDFCGDEDYENEIDCISAESGLCKWLDQPEVCQCSSDIELDIFFGIDASWSIGSTDFQTKKDWLTKVTSLGISNYSRIAFGIFSTSTWDLTNLTFWEYDDLVNYAENIIYYEGWTNTPQLVQDAIDEFDLRGDDDRPKLLIITTDGIPCMPVSGGGCPLLTLCSYETAIKSRDIRTIIIGIGDSFDHHYVECLVETSDDIIFVTEFDPDALDDIMPEFSDILCPANFALKTTKKP